uniref:Uncharacterized protein n=1 Tax=viral metagenome TaxID=1070528 RepID=A0A6C0E3G5_9ZZZZ
MKLLTVLLFKLDVDDILVYVNNIAIKEAPTKIEINVIIVKYVFAIFKGLKIYIQINKNMNRNKINKYIIFVFGTLLLLLLFIIIFKGIFYIYI